ncbi:MAG: hypothetical protein PWP65_1875 [Clostridia bacterium]|nr:hypothetical protein [Clostridia bacterium]
MAVPSFLEGLFRNYDPQSIDVEKHAEMIIKAVLSRGTWEQVKWIFEQYGVQKVREVFLKDYYGLRTLPESTRRLWELVFVQEPRQEHDRMEKWRCRRIPPRSETCCAFTERGT